MGASVYGGGFSDALYVISEHKGSWYCQAVRPDQGSVQQRRPLPEEWAGLEGERLVEASGVEDAVFCHAGRFVCAAGSLEGAVMMAQIAAGDAVRQTT